MKEERRHDDGFPLNKPSERIPGSLTCSAGGQRLRPIRGLQRNRQRNRQRSLWVCS